MNFLSSIFSREFNDLFQRNQSSTTTSNHEDFIIEKTLNPENFMEFLESKFTFDKEKDQK